MHMVSTHTCMLEFKTYTNLYDGDIDYSVYTCVWAHGHTRALQGRRCYHQADAERQDQSRRDWCLISSTGRVLRSLLTLLTYKESSCIVDVIDQSIDVLDR